MRRASNSYPYSRSISLVLIAALIGTSLPAGRPRVPQIRLPDAYSTEALAAGPLWVRGTPLVRTLHWVIDRLRGRSAQIPPAPPDFHAHLSSPASAQILKAAAILRRTRGLTQADLDRVLQAADLSESIPDAQEASRLQRLFDDVEQIRGDFLLANCPRLDADRFRNFYAVYKTYEVKDWALTPTVVWLEARLNAADPRPAFVSPLNPEKDIQEWRAVQQMHAAFLESHGLAPDQERKVLRKADFVGPRPGLRLLKMYPRHFSVPWDINDHMRPGQERVDRVLAAQQWEREVALLLEAGVEIELMDQHPALADEVFTANGPVVDFARRRVIVPRFAEPQRQAETLFFADYFQRQGYEVLDVAGTRLWEGEGDTLVFRRRSPVTALVAEIRFGGYGAPDMRFRSNLDAQEDVARELGQEFVGLELIDSRYYHLDTALFPLNDGRTVLYVGASVTGRVLRSLLVLSGLWPRFIRSTLFRRLRRVIDFGAFSAQSERELRRRFGANAVRIDGRNAEYFAANGISIGRQIFVNRLSSGFIRRLARRGITVLQSALSEFMKSGGSWKCLSLILEPVSIERFNWIVPLDAGRRGEVALQASELAAQDIQAIRDAGKPLIQRVMERADRHFKFELSAWIALYPASSARGADRWTAHRRLAQTICADLLAKTPLRALQAGGLRPLAILILGIAGWAGYVSGLTWTARHFILAGSAAHYPAIQKAVERMGAQGVLSTVCLAGEQARTDADARTGVENIAATLEQLRLHPPAGDPVHMAIKLSALVAGFDPGNSDHRQKATERARTIVQSAQSAGVAIDIDGETRAERDAQIAIFQTLAAELPAGAPLNIVVQSYFRDSDKVIDGLVAHAARHGYALGIRLVKGAYYVAERKAGSRVWETPADTDQAFRALTERLLRFAAQGRVYPMIASMNPREQAWAYAVARDLHLAPAQWESQMLYGMQPELLKRMRARGQHVRLYLLFGDDVISGSKYFDRRRPEFTGERATTRLVSDPTVSIESLAAVGPVLPAFTRVSIEFSRDARRLLGRGGWRRALTMETAQNTAQGALRDGLGISPISAIRIDVNARKAGPALPLRSGDRLTVRLKRPLTNSDGDLHEDAATAPPRPHWLFKGLRTGA